MHNKQICKPLILTTIIWSHIYWISSIGCFKKFHHFNKDEEFLIYLLEDVFLDDFFSVLPVLFISVLVIKVVLFFFDDDDVSDGSTTVT